MRYNYLYMDPWSAPQKEINGCRKPIYVCLSGNSGAGKSTLLRKVSAALYAVEQSTIAIDEKAVHHQLLPYLFDDTSRYGYLLQLNFMIQRALLIKSWLDKGFNLVMERSHIEDYIFINFMLHAGYINHSQHNTYMNLWDQLNDLIPYPDIIAFLNFGIEHSIENIQKDEFLGIRPKEFISEELKYHWISGWHTEYQSFVEKLPASLRERVLICSSSKDIDTLSERIIHKIHEIRRAHASKDHSLSNH